MRRVYHSFCALALLSSLLLASPAQAGGLSRQKKHAKRSNRYNSNWSYSLYRASRPSYSGYSGASTSSSSRRNLELVPDTVDKRTIYTGRYCAYPVKKLVPQRFTNGTQTYRKRVVSHCPWNDLYCNPTISYVIARRRLYATRMAVVTRDEWRCCPGFSGDTCSNVCFNCSIVEALKEKVEQLSQQTTGPATSQGAVGPPGQPGPRGAAGPAGPPGPDGLTGQPGLVGPKGQKGSRGMMGLHGFAGLKGDRGEAGSPGATGAPGTSGLKGEKGEEGDIGPTGLDGAKGEPGVNGTDGLNGLKGERGDIGPAGPTGPPGNGNSSAPGVKGDRGLPGIQGAAGPPGPPGVCGCPDSTATPSESTPVVSPGSNACIHEGQIYANNHLWKSDTCTECVCLDGDVHCFSIECPMTTSCQHKYVPEGYCCQVCCPADEDASSGEGSGEDDDGSEETSSSSSSSSVSSHQERSAERPPEDYPAYEYDYDGVEDRTRRSVEKSSQCPLSGVNSRMTPQGTDSRCILPVDSGPCRGRFAKFHYNEASGTCQRFVYGGCEGNANNFETPELCKRTCIDGAPPIGVSPPSEIAFGDPPQRRCLDAVQFDTCNHTFPEYYFDYRVDVCFRAPRGLCSVTRNRFHTPGECESVCQGPYMIFGVSTPENIDAPRLDLPKICTFPRKDGSCRGRFPRFYFSVKENRCKLFTYSGCSGNANRFLTPWACRDACGGKEPSFLHSDSDTLPERCYKPRIKGICKASIPMFYYNPITDKCNVFVYGGCGGNDNRFEEASQCTKVCGGEPSLEFEPYKPDPPTISSRNASPKGTDIENLPAADGALPVACAEPLRAGPCRASLYRYFFDAATRRCSVFVYGGCRGNGNNFETPEECQDVCGAHGFNYSVTLESDLNQQDVQPRGFTGELASPASGVAGPAGPKGEKGDAGPMGPQGIPGVGTTGEPGPKGSKGEATRSSSSAPLDRDQMSEVRKTIELLRSRIAFLERQFLNNLDPTGGGDGNIEEILLPNLVRPDKADDDLSGFDSDSPDSSSFNDDLLRSNAAPRGRGDNAEPSGPRPRSAIRHRGRPILVSDSSFEMRSEE